MATIQYVPEMDKFAIRWKDGSFGWVNVWGLENLYPDFNWQVVKENPGQVFYL